MQCYLRRQGSKQRATAEPGAPHKQLPISLRHAGCNDRDNLLRHARPAPAQRALQERWWAAAGLTPWCSEGVRGSMNWRCATCYLLAGRATSCAKPTVAHGAACHLPRNADYCPRYVPPVCRGPVPAGQRVSQGLLLGHIIDVAMSSVRYWRPVRAPLTDCPCLAHLLPTLSRPNAGAANVSCRA